MTESESEVVNQESILLRLSAGFRRALLRMEVNRSVVYGILAGMWNIISVPVTLWLIATRFTPEIQGYYYTFYAIVGLQIFVELGFGVVIVQFAAHEWARLRLDKDKITGDTEAISRLISLAKIVFRWFSFGGLFFTLALMAGGWFFFSRSPAPGISWAGPWFLLCGLSGLNVCLLPFWPLLQGCNQVSRVYAFWLFQGILRSVVIWLAIFWGAGLWTPALSLAAVIIWAVIYLRLCCLPFLRIFFSKRAAVHTISWKSELWPMQWKIAVSAVSSYFISSLFTPLLFYYQGAIVAGQAGMSLSIMSSLAGFTAIWFQARVPAFGMLVAREEYGALDRLFFRVSSISLALLAAGSIAIWLATYLLNIFEHQFAGRILSPLPMALFLAANLLIQGTSPFSVYVRAHKKEPFLMLSLVSGGLAGLLVWVLGSRFSAVGAGYGYLAVAGFCVFPWTLILWARYRRSHGGMTAVKNITDIGAYG